MAEYPIGYFVPGIVDGAILIARSDLAAIVVSHLEVFPDGIEIPMSIYVRDPEVFEQEADEREHDRRLRLRTGPWRLQPLAQYDISFDVEFPDGTNLTTDEPYTPTPAPSQPPQKTARAGIDVVEGRGTGGRHQLRMFLWPIPGPGTMRFVCAWPEQQIAETATDVDAATLHDAAARATTLWRDDAGRPSHYGVARRLPPGSSDRPPEVP